MNMLTLGISPVETTHGHNHNDTFGHSLDKILNIIGPVFMFVAAILLLIGACLFHWFSLLKKNMGSSKSDK